MQIKKRLWYNAVISLCTVLLVLLSLAWSFREIFIADRNIKLADEMRKVAFERILLQDEYLLYQEERAKTQWHAKSEALRELLALADARFIHNKDNTFLQAARKDFDTTTSGFSRIMEGSARQAYGADTKPAFTDAESQLISQVFLKAYSLNANIDRLHESAQTMATKARNRGAFIVIGLITGGIIVLIINSAVIRRTLADRITALNKGVEILGAGDLDHRIAVEGDDELADLAKANNEMAAKLKNSYTSVENLQKEIAERRRTEEALLASEAKLSEAQKMAQLGNWVWDVRTGNVEWSEETYRIFQRDPGTFTPHIDSILSLSPWPEDHERDKELIRKAMESHEKGNYEQRFLRPDGSTGYYYSTFQGKYDDEGKLSSIVGTVLDITERKKAEEEIRKLNEELEQRVRDRTAQLEAANKELEGFSYSVSHDLRAPLRHITGFAELLIRKAPAELDDKSRHYLTVVSDSARQMGKLVDDLLSFSRMGRAEMLQATMDLNMIVSEAVEACKAEIVGRDIEWKIGRFPVAYGDKVMLKIVFENLISNAIKFTRTRSEAIIEVGFSADRPAELVCYVRDNGVGFDMKYVDKLFGLFQRLHRPEEFEGTGLGLANVRRIIHRHGGRTWAEGKINEGAAIFFSLPKTREV
ncbi:MAG: ATP-binding protein [Thermodesulfovibrionales bacterium]